MEEEIKEEQEKVEEFKEDNKDDKLERINWEDMINEKLLVFEERIKEYINQFFNDKDKTEEIKEEKIERNFD